MRRTDPAGLGRGPLTLWLPVIGQAAPDPPAVGPYEAARCDTPGRFLARVIFSVPHLTIPALLLAVVWQVGESAVPVVAGIAIDRALASGEADRLVWWVGALIVLYVALTVAARLANRLNVTAVQSVQHRLRSTLSTRALHPVDGVVRRRGGEIVSIMTNDVLRLSNGVLLVTIPASRVAAIVFIAISLLSTQQALGVAVLVGAPMVAALTGLLSRRLARSTAEYQGLLAATIERATDLVTGYRVIKGIRAEPEATRRYAQASQETLSGAKRTAGALGRFHVVSGIISAVFVAAVTGLAAWFAVDGHLSIGELITTVGLTQALLPQIQGITGISIPNLASAHAAAARILDTVRAAEGDMRCPNVRRTGDPVSTPVGDEAPDVEMLQMQLPGGQFRVARGELLGVHAHGRTAADITGTLLDPHNARKAEIEFRLAGRPAAEMDPDEYRSLVTVAPHRTALFTGTIRDNLTTPTSTPARIVAALAAAACEDFVTDLDAPVGENGNRLSGGQKQRAALARALATGAPILVLHEPTTAVDSVTEQVIADRLRTVRSGRSTLLITSSPTLLGCCDRVIDLREDSAAADAPMSDAAVTR